MRREAERDLKKSSKFQTTSFQAARHSFGTSSPSSRSSSPPATRATSPSVRSSTSASPPWTRRSSASRAEEGEPRSAGDRARRDRSQEELLDNGLTNRSEYTALLRAEAELIGQVGSLQSQIASSSTQIIETKQQIERLTTSARRGRRRRAQHRARDHRRRRGAGARRAACSIHGDPAPADGIIVRSVHNSVAGRGAGRRAVHGIAADHGQTGHRGAHQPA